MFLGSLRAAGVCAEIEHKFSGSNCHSSFLLKQNVRRDEALTKDRQQAHTAWMAAASVALTRMAVVPLSMIAVVAAIDTHRPFTFAPLSATFQYLQNRSSSISRRSRKLYKTICNPGDGGLPKSSSMHSYVFIGDGRAPIASLALARRSTLLCGPHV